MTKFTKEAIRASFMKILNTKPFDSLTIKEIADDCGINRNTFYYNYKDIYALLDDILQCEMQKLIEEHKECSSWNETLLCAADFAIKNKKAISHLHHSQKKEQLEKYLWKAADYAITKFVRREAEGEDISEEDILFVGDFYACALTGMLEKWLDSDMEMDFSTVINKMGIMFNSNIKQAIKALAESRSR